MFLQTTILCVCDHWELHWELQHSGLWYIHYLLHYAGFHMQIEGLRIERAVHCTDLWHRLRCASATQREGWHTQTS